MPPAARIARSERELGLAVEPVARTCASNVVVPARSIQSRCRWTALVEPVLARRARRAHGREDAAAGGVQLLVARAAPRAARTPRPGRRRSRVRVAVDEARDRAAPAPSSSSTSPSSRAELAHRGRPPRSSPSSTEHVRVLDHVDRPRSRPRNGAPAPDGVASWRGRGRAGAVTSRGRIGTSSPPARAASIASW